MSLPPASKIKFFNGLPDFSADFQISIIPYSVDYELASLSPKFDESRIIEIHSYARLLSEDIPDEIIEMGKEIERIILENPTGLASQGIPYINMITYREFFDDDNTKNIWRYVNDVQIFLRNFITNNKSDNEIVEILLNFIKDEWSIQ